MAEDRACLKKAGILIIAAGAVLILSALLLLLHNRLENTSAGQKSEVILAEIETAVADTSSKESVSDAAEAALPRLPDPEMPTVILDGYAYVGYIQIPALSLELPVMSEWDYERLNISPCRQFGSSRTGDLVIAAHNYQSHFGRLKELAPGDTVTFTDADGLLHEYSVEDIQILQPTEVDAVQNSGFDLVLYTCTYGGQSRVAVFCNTLIAGQPSTVNPPSPA